jgi:phosphoenolpyruvate synthase/pyruvate phosphate dikinase
MPPAHPAPRAPAQGTGVTVQAMAFGNMGATSGTGVCFTRNPSTGEAKLYGEYLINAQARLTALIWVSDFGRV